MNTLAEIVNGTPARDSGQDGRPAVNWTGADRLLEALCRAHPELIPEKLKAERLKAELATKPKP